MVQGLSLAEEWDYVPAADQARLTLAEKAREKDPEAPLPVVTEFHLRRPSIENEVWITDAYTANKGALPVGSASLRLLPEAICGYGWRNFPGPDGAPIEPVFDEASGRLTLGSLKRIPRDLRIELTLEVIRAGRISRVDVEKSAPASTSPSGT